MLTGTRPRIVLSALAISPNTAGSDVYGIRHDVTESA